MQISSVSLNKSNLNQAQKQQTNKMGFSGVTEYKNCPEFDHLIRETKTGVIFPVIKEIKKSIADGTKACWVALTGKEATECRNLEQVKDPFAFEKVVKKAKESGLYKKA
ncbi:MAG TPA: hypothetical protein DDW90_05750 [Cyanobacteria bacterium UBA9971]|nr:hypothetical protein [Cyanobacteria bacterium UBA9971]